MNGKKIKVLIVDDSNVSRDLMTYIIELDNQLEVMGVAENGVDALKMIKSNKPDVVITDIVMPKMDGFELTKRIMTTCPLPIVVISGAYNTEEVRSCFQAIDAGALAILEKPKGIGDAQSLDTARFISDTIKAMAQAKLQAVQETGPVSFNSLKEKASIPSQKPSKAVQAIAIGASIGGPKALRSILAELPENFGVPIFIAQHITSGFLEGFVQWLDSCTPLHVKLAEDGEAARAGCVYITPNKYYMEVDKDRIIHLVEAPSRSPEEQSIAHLFKSIRGSFGPACAAVMLTGIGSDGVDEMKNIHTADGITIAQNAETSVKFDLPGRVIEKGAAKHIEALQNIPLLLVHLAEQKTAKTYG
ncbi:MAG: response regulator [Chlamydiales bacterium]|nr:response regulator [Chlamydiia bacterium]MCP5508683.1 response regulator [Chlamydiales bacterium]